MKLSRLISNLKELEGNAIKITEKEVKDMFWAVLKEMSLLTIMDSGQAKSTIVGIFLSKYGYDISEVIVEEIYNFWDNNDRWWGNMENVSYTDMFDGQFAHVGLSIDDEGLYAQENGMIPSEIVAEERGRDNSQYMPRHITHVSDNFDEIEGFRIAVENICKKIELHILK